MEFVLCLTPCGEIMFPLIFLEDYIYIHRNKHNENWGLFTSSRNNFHLRPTFYFTVERPEDRLVSVCGVWYTKHPLEQDAVGYGNKTIAIVRCFLCVSRLWHTVFSSLVFLYFLIWSDTYTLHYGCFGLASYGAVGCMGTLPHTFCKTAVEDNFNAYCACTSYTDRELVEHTKRTFIKEEGKCSCTIRERSIRGSNTCF